MKQSEALSVLKTGANAYLTGEPGSGKTHTINAYISWLRDNGIEPAITASTGIAATHIGGMTIHSWSGLGIKEELSRSDLDAIVSKEHVVRRITKAGVLIIDEISMLSGETLCMVDKIVREARNDGRPFGGLQVVLVGDFFQLPPIKKYGRSASFAFTSSSWEALHPLPLYLEEQYRQEDESLLRILKNIREGTADHTDVSKVMTQACEGEEVPEDIPRLYTHNVDVDEVNKKKLASLPGNIKTFIMETTGAPLLVEALKRGCLSAEELQLKEGAVVMFTRNMPSAGYSNGTIGTITGFSRGAGLPIVQTRDGRTIYVEQGEWVVEEGGKIRAKIAQLPLRLSWALTIHKSQGQSIDAAAIDLSRTFEYGQGYVALSRLRTLSGLHLLGFSENAFLIHPEVSRKDEHLRRLSEEAANTFAALEERGERELLEKRFIEALGGGGVKKDKKEKISTYEITRSLMKEGKALTAIAKERGLTLATIADHVEHLLQVEEIQAKELLPLVEEDLIQALPEIIAVFEKVGHERLAPAYVALKRRFEFPELKIARALYLCGH